MNHPRMTTGFGSSTQQNFKPPDRQESTTTKMSEAKSRQKSWCCGRAVGTLAMASFCACTGGTAVPKRRWEEAKKTHHSCEELVAETAGTQAMTCVWFYLVSKRKDAGTNMD